MSGGALTYGKNAPPLTAATPTQIYEAMLTGPEAMPVFADGSVSPQAKRDIIAYITQTRSEPNPGGFSLGRTGPITEGLVIFFGGLGFLILIALWITARRRDPRPTGME
jgi:ubiquinol-cytochrome c reductase cytochrome c subunit